MKIGILKKWNELQGWGFIECEDDGEDYFFHASNARKGLKISEGMQLKFDAQIGQKGDEAKNVSHI